jgi:copper(I)-binding protein
MKPLLLAAALFAVGHAAALPVQAVQPWSRPAVAGATAVGYLTLVNRGPGPQTLTGASSPMAAKVELHSSSMAGGVMRMEKTPQVVIPAGGEVAFAPGGRHLMLIGLKAALKPGDHVPLTLAFSDGRRLKTELEVGTGLGPPEGDHARH